MAALSAVCFYVLCFLFGAVHAQLFPNFYANSCPDARNKIQEWINGTVSQEPRMGASLLRLHFHDCFVNGCDASVLLDNTLTAIGEKTAVSNINSLRGFEVIDAIKSQVERLCPGVVSCADIIAVAARDSVVALGGPTYNVQLGRKDSFAADILRANLGLPLPIFSLDRLKDSFASRGLSVTDLVALSRAHTVGQVTCQNIRGRIYAPSKMNPSFAASLREKCPIISGNRNPIPFDGTPYFFDNTYFKDLVNMKGLLHTDQVLYNNDFTDSLVYNYSTNAAAFFADFKTAMVKLGNINPLTGARGEIRTNCRRKNLFI